MGAAIYSSYKPLTTIEHLLLAKGIVLDDGDQRYVLCAVDWCELCNSTHTLFRKKMAVAAGTSISRVAVQTIHQHTAPMGDADAFRLLERIEDPPPHLPPEFFDKMATAHGAFRPPGEKREDFARVAPESAQRREADAGIECIGCGVCYAACDVVAWDPDYLGPAALNRAWTQSRSAC